MKNKEVPYEGLYKAAKKLDKALFRILIVSASVSCVFIIFSFFSFEYKGESIVIVNIILALLAVIYFMLEFIKEEMFQKAETERKLDFVDNSLNTKFSLVNSKGYFSNDEINASIHKLGVNCFENSFFTYEISKKMLPVAIFKFVIVLILFVSVALFSNELLLMFIQVPLPFVLLKDSYRIHRLNQDVCGIIEKFQSVYSMNELSQSNELIINNVISYEKILSRYSILLDSRLFESLNHELTVKWEELKKKYNIFNK